MMCWQRRELQSQRLSGSVSQNAYAIRHRALPSAFTVRTFPRRNQIIEELWSLERGNWRLTQRWETIYNLPRWYRAHQHRYLLRHRVRTRFLTWYNVTNTSRAGYLSIISPFSQNK